MPHLAADVHDGAWQAEQLFQKEQAQGQDALGGSFISRLPKCVSHLISELGVETARVKAQKGAI